MEQFARFYTAPGESCFLLAASAFCPVTSSTAIHPMVKRTSLHGSRCFYLTRREWCTPFPACDLRPLCSGTILWLEAVFCAVQSQIGGLIMNIGFWFCIVLVPCFGLMAVLFWAMGSKAARFVSGFSSLSPQEQAQYDQARLARDTGNNLFLWAGIMLVVLFYRHCLALIWPSLPIWYGVCCSLVRFIWMYTKPLNPTNCTNPSPHHCTVGLTNPMIYQPSSLHSFAFWHHKQKSHPSGVALLLCKAACFAAFCVIPCSRWLQTRSRCPGPGCFLPQTGSHGFAKSPW